MIDMHVGSIIMAAGRGSRMKGFAGNKTLLPLVAGDAPYEGHRPILLHILGNLPQGPKAVVVHHRKEDVIKATHELDLVYCEQPQLNGTGGALLAARRFIETLICERVLITMGDVPLVKRSTYEALVRKLEDQALVVLGFRPESKKRYGVLDVEGEQVRRIIEWEYWKTFPDERQAALTICNSGIYAARRTELIAYLTVLASKPHIVRKEIAGKSANVEEFFVTDLVEYMDHDGLGVGYLISESETEVVGVDDIDAWRRAQELFSRGLFFSG
jgi:bifunctional UDP-N-acetylglucosamine pyrophosphorylase/glucosamine-1-phosphate N-acetyltransferase